MENILYADLEKYMVFILDKFYSTFTTAYTMVVESKIIAPHFFLYLRF